MGRILAIDYGTKRIGLAVTDPLQIIATPLETIHPKDLIEYLKAYHMREVLESIVLGMPVNTDGSATHTTPIVKGLAKQLKKIFPDIPLFLEDERFTSKIALQALIAGGSTKAYRREKGNIDKASAAVILQSFMERRQNGFVSY